MTKNRIINWSIKASIDAKDSTGESGLGEIKTEVSEHFEKFVMAVC